MAERSQFWTTNNTGHGPDSGYASDRWQAFLRKAFLSNIAASGGVCFGVDNQLAVSGAASPLTLATGAAFVYGFFYENDTPLNLAVTTPVVNTTGGHVVLRVNFAAQTVTAVAVRNTDGVAAIPELTQTPGTTYEIRLASFTITTGGVITVTDTRVFAKFSGKVSSDQLDQATVIAALGYTPINKGASGDQVAGRLQFTLQSLLVDTLYNDAPLALRIDATAGQPTAVPAIGFHRANEVGAAIYLAGGGSYANFRIRGNGGQDVPLWNGGNDGSGSGLDADMLRGVTWHAIRRQGNASGSDWYNGGTSNYAPTSAFMQVGANTITCTAGQVSAVKDVTFPIAFANKPLVFTSIDFATGFAPFAIQFIDNVTASGFRLRVHQDNNRQFTLTGSPIFSWIAIGPPA